MDNNNEIVNRVINAKSDPKAADKLISDYLPFIKSETSKAIRPASMEGKDDEVSIAMFAFYEAIQTYSKLKGAFLSYASLVIKRKLIDFYRKEKKHFSNISLDEPMAEDNNTSLLDTLENDEDDISVIEYRRATNEEIEELSLELSSFDLNLSDIANSCPKWQRTLSACKKVVEYAKDNKEIIEELKRTKRLPIAKITKGVNVDRKTIERHRKYIMALMVIYSNGYEIIRGHLNQVHMKGDDA